jgi:hypothetical protein
VKLKRFINILASILIVSSIVGCSNSTSSEEKTTTDQSTDNKASANSNTKAFEKPDLYGEVSEVIGNEVTLKLLKMPEMPAQNGQKGGTNAGNVDDKGSNVAPNDANADGSGGTGTGGGMRQKEYTGEEKTMVIPVGTSLVTTTRSETGMTESEISLNELKSGYTLSVYYKKDGKTIEKISVRKPRTGGGQGGDTGEGGKFRD